MTKPLRKQRAPRRILLLYILSDLLAFTASFFLALWLAEGINNIFFDRSLDLSFAQDGSYYVTQFTIVGGGILVWFAHKRHYIVRMPFWQEAKDIVSGAAFALLIDGFLQFAAGQDSSRLWIMFCWLVFVFLCIGFRSLMRWILRRMGLWAIPTLLIGNGPTAREVLAALKSEPGMGYEITTQIDGLGRTLSQAGGSWKTLFAKHGIYNVIMALEATDYEKNKDSIDHLIRENLPFSMVPPLPAHMPVSSLLPLYLPAHNHLHFVPLRGLQQPLPRFIKRTIDIVVSSMALLVLSPILIVIAIIIKSDGGPALFGHQRLGKDGKPFSCLKFRSMVVDSEKALKNYLAKNPEAAKEWQEEWKLREDPRITRIGHFLRKWSLDELPQLLNVLRGEMSLVGPRPVVVQETAKYSSDVQYYYSVRPGLTGLWQVSGRSDVSYPMRVHMDSWYVRNWSVWHDLIIILKTFRVLIKRSGAY